ncbi:LVIVD repeat-containing protein [Rufibacter glacialis]|uniref:LVIVD repeat-containing protein n=1 Tax=Rufibacter glacialis TaxID=1259555 RepID=A0A5M8Q7E8_9BACT|nr:hypothetical protein [Rufibacter glacialis]KAA6431855.1 hypothetical protein FOE74_17240 [Rufibacter glacialis]GGK80990.1 hypothetical protein GCM10011405_30940 [Rufibacter glacialis]
MQPKLLLLFKPFYLVLFWGFFLASCTDECESTISYTVYEPVYLTKEELRTSVKVEPARALQNPGKIYSYGDYLFVNEVGEGIHVIDNRVPSSPQVLRFLSIPGNVDLAVKDNTLYADSYIDLVVLDISQPLDIKLVNRLQDVLPVNGVIVNPAATTFLAKYNPKQVTAPYSSDCGAPVQNGRGILFDNISTQFSNKGLAGAAMSSPQGKGGSMARFTITGDHLYTVSLSSLQLFDISQQNQPQKGQRINLGWGIETIFPYQDKLFIGSTNGMHIYDNANPASPVHLSTYAHVNSCDPVVVEGDLAWVTLRSGNACAGFTNQLEVINISNPRSPKMIKTYPMQNPHGLGIDQSTLFLCEGAFGLKVFDVKDPLAVTNNLLKHFKNQDAYDVIPLGHTLLLVGKDGLYQFDYSNLAQMKLISKIPVAPANS